MKKILISICVVAIVAVSLWFVFAQDTMHRNGVLHVFPGTGKGIPVDITISQSKLNKLLKDIKSDILVKGENIDYIYKVHGEILKLDEFYALHLQRFGKNGLESHGDMCFDDNMENIVIVTIQEEIYSASDEFVEMILERTSRYREIRLENQQNQ